VFVPRTSSTSVATWFWQTEGRSVERVILGVRPSELILLEFQSPSRRIFIGSHSLPPLWSHNRSFSQHHHHYVDTPARWTTTLPLPPQPTKNKERDEREGGRRGSETWMSRMERQARDLKVVATPPQLPGRRQCHHHVDGEILLT
jgi:hypothetical protein